MHFRQLLDPESSTYTYLLGDPATRCAVLIDPVLEQVERDLACVRELGLTLTHVLETHVHADHITGAGELRERTGCEVVASEHGAACVSRGVKHGDEVRVGALCLRVLATPGHTDDSVCYLLGDRVFTGDTLLIRANGRTDFQNGDAGALYDSITRELFTLPDATRVFPAHDYQGRAETTIGEEKRHNPRLAGRTREDFIQRMGSLQLPPPKKLAVAVPANRACGRVPPSVQDIAPERLDTLTPEVRHIDVREPDEFEGPLGHLPRAELVPLGELERVSEGWARETPLLLICRSGRRSASAAQALASRGFRQLYNLRGGMLAVRGPCSPKDA